jgi:hypothetical protein
MLLRNVSIYLYDDTMQKATVSIICWSCPSSLCGGHFVVIRSWQVLHYLNGIEAAQEVYRLERNPYHSRICKFTRDVSITRQTIGRSFLRRCGAVPPLNNCSTPDTLK